MAADTEGYAVAGGITLAWGACSRSEICTGLSPRHFCAVVGLCSGPALTTRGRHIQRLVCSTWARNRFGDRPLLRRAHDLRTLALTLRWAESSATPRHFCAGVRLCSGPALTTRGRHTQRLVCPTRARCRVHFCAGHMIPVRWPLLCAASAPGDVTGGRWTPAERWRYFNPKHASAQRATLQDPINNIHPCAGQRCRQQRPGPIPRLRRADGRCNKWPEPTLCTPTRTRAPPCGRMIEAQAMQILPEFLLLFRPQPDLNGRASGVGPYRILCSAASVGQPYFGWV